MANMFFIIIKNQNIAKVVTSAIQFEILCNIDPETIAIYSELNKFWLV